MSANTKTAVIYFLLAGCINTDTSDLPTKCDDANPCPSPKSCVDSLCVDPPIDGMSADLTTDAGTGSDGGISPPCKDPGSASILGPSSAACPGSFAAGKGNDLCGADWQMCKSAAGISTATCDLLDGFFVADVPGYFVSAQRTMPLCGPNAANSVFFGCGKLRVYTADTPANKCGNFSRNVECGAPRPWTCSPTGTIQSLANSEPTDGVLCCKK